MPRVVIIGAGMAGIAAAAELAARKMDDFVVLEARDRIGGRLHTVREPFGPVELGAAWFHEVPNNFLVSVARDNSIEAVFDDEATVLYDENGPIAAKDFKVAGDFAAWRSAQPETSLERALVDFSAHAKLNSEDAARLGSIEAFQQLPTGLPTSKISSKYPPGGGRDMAIRGGYDQVLKAVGSSIRESKIKLGEPVVSVTVGSEGPDSQVVVKTTKGTYTADSVIVAAPSAVLKAESIAFSPPLPSPLATAISNTSVASLAKVYCEFPSVFWPQQTLKFVITGKTPVVIYNWMGVHGGQKILGVIVSHSLVEAVESDPASAFKAVKPFFELIKTPGATVPQPINTVSTSWQKDKYSAGAISTYEMGKSRAEATAEFEIGHPPLFFAGEHATNVGATFVHGAYLSGHRAAKQALAASTKL